MLPVRVSGLAVPFNVANSYNETMAPHALDAFIERFNKRGKPLPMGFMHEFAVGYWDKLVLKPDGLYVEGEITNQDALGYLDKVTGGKFNGELSITFQDRDNAHGLFAETRERFNSRSRWEQLHAPRGLKLYDAKTTEAATLTEISLVDRGAFPGTHFAPVDLEGRKHL